MALALGMAASFACWSTIHRWRANAYRRTALAELRAAGTRQDQLRVPPDLLKRTALTAFPREQVAARGSDAWLAFLDETGAATGFAAGYGRALGEFATIRPWPGA